MVDYDHGSTDYNSPEYFLSQGFRRELVSLLGELEPGTKDLDMLAGMLSDREEVESSGERAIIRLHHKDLPKLEKISGVNYDSVMNELHYREDDLEHLQELNEERQYFSSGFK